MMAPWPGAQSARDNHFLDCNFAKYSPNFIFFHWQAINNKPYLMWLLTITPHLKYVTTLHWHCLFHKVV